MATPARQTTADPASAATSANMLMLDPSSAWRLLRRRTGGAVSRATFYRWLNSGKVYSIRLGFRIYVPWPALEEFIKQCLAGERF